MTLQEKIQKKAEGFGKLAPAFLEGAKFALENQWISVKDDLPCNHEELLDQESYNNETVIVLTACGNSYFLNWMELKRHSEWEWHNIQNITHWMKLPELPKE